MSKPEAKAVLIETLIESLAAQHGLGAVGMAASNPVAVFVTCPLAEAKPFLRTLAAALGGVVQAYVFGTITWAHPALARVRWLNCETPPRMPVPKGAVMKLGHDRILLERLPHFYASDDVPMFYSPQTIRLSEPVGGWLV